MARLRPVDSFAPSERLYRLLLLAYPRAFREEYAAEMLLAFRDACRDAAREGGALRVLRLWSDLVRDFALSICTQYAQTLKQWSRRVLARPITGQVAVAAPLTLRVAQRTDLGRVRASNEDCLLSIVPDDDRLLRARGALFVVSDGMGGRGRGDVASALAVQQVKDAYYHNRRDDIPTALRAAVKYAGAAVCRECETICLQGGGQEMGATCVAAVLHERMLYVANVGDSRVYVQRAGHLRQVTRDHSLVARMVERGELTPAQARAHPKRSLIYRALGLPDVEVDSFAEPVEQGDVVILCTDGLCAVVEDDELRAIVEGNDPDESVRRLIARANAAGGPDNVTAIVVRVS